MFSLLEGGAELARRREFRKGEINVTIRVYNTLNNRKEEFSFQSFYDDFHVQQA